MQIDDFFNEFPDARLHMQKITLAGEHQGKLWVEAKVPGIKSPYGNYTEYADITDDPLKSVSDILALAKQDRSAR